MTFVIDTDVAIHLRDRDPVISAKIAQLSAPVVMSIISWVELEGGIHADRAVSNIRRARLDVLLRAIDVLPFEGPSAVVYGKVVEATGFSRRKVFDRMIAAQALVLGATLVTRNGDDFRDIPGLKLLEW